MKAELMTLAERRMIRNEAYYEGHKRIKLSNYEKKQLVSSKVIDYSDPLAISYLIEGLDSGKYGSVTKEIDSLINQKIEVLGYYLAMHPKEPQNLMAKKMSPNTDGLVAQFGAINSKVDCSAHRPVVAHSPVVIIDSDDEDIVKHEPPTPFQEVVLTKPADQFLMEIEVKSHIDSESQAESVADKIHIKNGMNLNGHNIQVKRDHSESRSQAESLADKTDAEKEMKGKSEAESLSDRPHAEKEMKGKSEAESLSGRPHAEKEMKGKSQAVSIAGETDVKKDKGVYVGVEEDRQAEAGDDGLGDIWKEMSLALESSKETTECPVLEKPKQGGNYCDHSFVLKDDLGYVCRICGIIDRGIDTIIEVQFNKGKKSLRTYPYDHYRGGAKDKDAKEAYRLDLVEEKKMMAMNIYAHPMHMRQMKPHQVEGFNFLCNNLVADNPGGCILAHAPGSGKTFMIISFIQSFLAKYPHARPLVVLPKGILSTWKREFQIWQVEDIPLHDFYSVKADGRAQQLEILKQWVEQKSILFLGYKQFSMIVCDDEHNAVSARCQEILLKKPSILILDEGHTPRNENTDVLQSLARVQTPRKVVLSGTLYQNHVKEVFNILNLVRPKFLRLDSSRSIVRRIMSKVQISGLRKHFKAGAEAAFFELVEHTIQKDDDFRRKVTVIRDLREMTSKVLHYYKGDFLDELPGLMDFTVVVNLSSKQKHEVDKLRKLARKFKRNSVGSAVYLHPKLSVFSENSSVTDTMMDGFLDKLNVKDGIKAKFFLNIVGMCESAEEKLLVFSQYLTPLKFLERLAARAKGWFLGREIFVISGESNSDYREWSMERFNSSTDARVFFGSIKACGEGISLVGASRILILDVHLNPSVTRQAIGRAFRPGQTKKVFVYRLVAGDSPEEEDHVMCLRKEVIAKMWFEWNEYCGYRNFEVETVDLQQSGDFFLESPTIAEDIRSLYRR